MADFIDSTAFNFEQGQRARKLFAAVVLAALDDAIADDKNAYDTDRLMARLKMSALPRNANPTRVRNRCEVTGRSRAYYRKFRLSRIMLRDLANKGMIPGVTKSSW